MIENAIGFVLILVGLGAVTLQRLYSAIPIRELKRLAGRGDSLAAALYRVVAYGVSLRLLLWLVVAITIPLGLLFTTLGLPRLAGFIVLFAVAVIGFVLLPSLQLTQRSALVAARCAPLIAWLLSYTHNALDKTAHTASRFRDVPRHSRLYEKEDLLDLLSRQRGQTDNRIHEDDLALVERALTFDDTRAADLVQPRKEVHLVDADESIGPLLLDQLHKQKQSSFLVYKDAPENIIGSLAMSDAITAKKGGRVFDLIRSDLIFVHEDFTARQVLGAFHRTGHQVAVVINNAEEFVGVITLDHLLQSLLGEATDDGIAYGSRSSVAAYRPKRAPADVPAPEQPATDDTSDAQRDTPSQQTDEQRPASSPEATEVVE